MKSEIRRTQLLELALAQIAVDGWPNTTHKSIARACGVNDTTVYSHFPKRSDLRNAIMADHPHLDLPDAPDLRMKPGDRHRMLMDKALELSARDGYKNVTMEALTTAAGVSRTLYARYFTSVLQFRVEVMRTAVKRRNLPIIAQGLVARDPHALKAPSELREAAIATLTV